MNTKPRKNPRNAIVEKRKAQLEELIVANDQLEKDQAAAKLRTSTLSSLESVSLGLYDEIDKLTKKAPVEKVTDLVLEQMNDVIRETKALILSDTFVQRLKEFVPAGDNPELRDALVVMRQVREGLKRFRENLTIENGRINDLLPEIQLVRTGVELYIETGETLSEAGIDDVAGDLPLLMSSSLVRLWMRGEYLTRAFNFIRLDNLNISEYFRVEKA